MKLTCSEISKAIQGSIIQGSEAHLMSRISKDSRELEKGDLYWVLSGNNFDGHRFLKDAYKKGASGAVISDLSFCSEIQDKNFVLIQVEDSLKALGDLAAYWRQKFSIPVIALTGSSGKTTTKEMIAHCLSKKGEVLKTKGNYNNLVGLPLTLLDLNEKHDFAVIEMGMNAFGEIKRLSEITSPTEALITNIGLAHLEGVGSIEGVAKAKGELFETLSSETRAFINLDDPFISKMDCDAQKITYSLSKEADYYVTDLKKNNQGMTVKIKEARGIFEINLPFYGDYLLQNFLVSYALNSSFGLSPTEIEGAIQTYNLPEDRGAKIKLKDDTLLIDDAYNANPSSMMAVLQSISEEYPSRRKIFVFGEMKELGKESGKYHHIVAKKAYDLKFDQLYFYGTYFQDVSTGFKGALHFASHDAMIKKLQETKLKGDLILIKGSRGSQMDLIVSALKED